MIMSSVRQFAPICTAHGHQQRCAHGVNFSASDESRHGPTKIPRRKDRAEETDGSHFIRNDGRACDQSIGTLPSMDAGKRQALLVNQPRVVPSCIAGDEYTMLGLGDTQENASRSSRSPRGAAVSLGR